MAPNVAATYTRGTTNSTSIHRRTCSSSQEQSRAVIINKQEAVYHSPKRSTSLPNGQPYEDPFVEVLRQVQVDRSVLLQLNRDLPATIQNSSGNKERPRMRRCISDVSVDIRKLEEREKSEAERAASQAQSCGRHVKRRVSFSDRQAVHDVDARDVYDRSAPEWIDSNFTAARMRYIRLELLTLKKEMQVHPHSNLTAKGLPIPAADEAGQVSSTARRTSAPVALLRQRGSVSIVGAQSSPTPALERIQSSGGALEPASGETTRAQSSPSHDLESGNSFSTIAGLPGDAPKSRFERVQALSTLDIAPAEDKPSHEVGVFEHTISNGREGITETCSEKVEDKRTAKFVNTLGRIFRTRLARHGEA